MTDLHTAQEYRLIQVFLSENGVFEVYAHTSRQKFACTCPGWRALRKCKHAAYVRDRYEAAGGCYPVKLRRGAVPEVLGSLGDPVAFRRWVIENVLVEVL